MLKSFGVVSRLLVGRDSLPSRFFGSSALGAVAVAALVLGAGGASAQVASLTEVSSYETVDRNGVNVATGSVVGQPHTVSIGPAQGGLSMSLTMDTSNGSFFRSSLDGLITKTPLVGEGADRPWYNLTLMGQTSIWAKPLEGFSAVEGDGTLTFDGRYYTHTAVDGTVATLDQELRTAAFILARITTIVRPNGEILTFHWKSVATGGTPMYERRLQSVTNNLGYQLHFQYAADVWGPGWSSLVKVTALNNAVDACAPLSNTCTFSQTWPSLSLTSTSTLRTITDAEENITRYGINGGRLASIQRPTSATPNLTFTWNSLYPTKIASVSDGAGTWQYDFSLPPGAPAELYYYDITTTITDPNNHQTLVTSGSWHEDPGVPGRRINRVILVTNPLNQTTAYVYGDGYYRLTRVMHPEGNEVLYGYDDIGTLLGVTRVAKGGQLMETTTGCATISLCGRPLAVTDARNNTTNYTYDQAGNVLTVTGPAPTSTPGDPRPQTRYTWEQRHAWYKQDGSGAITEAPSPVWVLVGQSQCMTGATC